MTGPLKVHLKKKFKTDQSGQGVDVFIGCTDYPLCPVAAALSYIITRGTAPGPFFKFPDGQPLTKPCFVTEVRNILQAVGLQYQHFAGHSFQIGATNMAARAGLEETGYTPLFPTLRLPSVQQQIKHCD